MNLALIATFGALIALASGQRRALIEEELHLDQPVLDFFRSAAELLERSGKFSGDTLPETIKVYSDIAKSRVDEVDAEPDVEPRHSLQRVDADETPAVERGTLGDRNNVTYSIDGSLDSLLEDHKNESLALVPTLKVYGDNNNVSFVAYFNATVRKDVQNLEDLFLTDPMPHRSEAKEYFASKYLEGTWFKAHGYCAAQGMKLAEFSTIEDYYSVIVALAQDKIKPGDFWISATKLMDSKSEDGVPDNRDMDDYDDVSYADDSDYHFFPSFVTVSSIGQRIQEGKGDCVYIKTLANYSATSGRNSPAIWGAGECNSHKVHKRFICEKEMRQNPFLHRLGASCYTNTIKDVLSMQPNAVLSMEPSGKV